MCTWAEKWQGSFNVTKCKKTHSGAINLRILLTIVQPQPGKEAQMAENYSLKTVLRGATATAQRLRERDKKKNVTNSKGIGNPAQRASLCPLYPVQCAAVLSNTALCLVFHTNNTMKVEMIKRKQNPMQ